MVFKKSTLATTSYITIFLDHADLMDNESPLTLTVPLHEVFLKGIIKTNRFEMLNLNFMYSGLVLHYNQFLILLVFISTAIGP